MQRCVEPEWLDTLRVRDWEAIRSRRDLQRLNAWMGNARTVSSQLRRLCDAKTPAGLVELGAGDGEFMLSVARRLPESWRGTRLLLVDKQPAASPDLAARFAELGWQAEVFQADALKFSPKANGSVWTATIANLFLHHFSEPELRSVLASVSPHTNALVAVEPRRSRLALLASRLVWVIGCHRVTRHDAPISVRAGFWGGELSEFWPDPANWELEERPVGFFGHLFVAHRKETS